MMENETIQTPSYRSLTQIRARKEALKKQIEEEDAKITTLWDKLFRPNEQADTSPSKRFTDVLNTGAGVLDALILGWKLYRKFSGKPLFRLKW